MKTERNCENCINSYLDEVLIEDEDGNSDYRLKHFCDLHLPMNAEKCKEWVLEE